MTAVKQLRLGVVGFGNRGVIAPRAAAADGHATVVAAYDPHPAGQERASAQLSDVETVTGNLEEFAHSGLDAAFITSPDAFHAEQAITLLEAGVPVFVDKPLAISLEDADRVLETAHRSGSLLYVGHNMRHMPVIRLMKDIVDSGRIGEVKAVWCRYFVGDGGDRFFRDWHAERANVNSLLLQKGAHDIDIIHWLAGGYTRRVSAMGGLTLYGQVTDRAEPDPREHPARRIDRDNHWPPLASKGLNPVIDVEDISMVTMHLDNGAFGTYQECHYTPDYWRNYTVIGTEGRIENFGLDSTGYVRLWNRRTEFKEHGDEEIPIPKVEGGHHGADPALLKEFLAFVREGIPTQTSPVAAREAVATASLATDSMRGGAVPRDVPALPDELRRYFDTGQGRQAKF